MLAEGFINGEPVSVVLDSVGTRFDDLPRLTRAKRMREHAAEHGQYAICDGAMVRCSEERGLSLAGQLEKELPDHSGMVFLALSRNKIYQATVYEGLVYTEEIHTPEEAEQALLADAGQAIVLATLEGREFAETFPKTELEVSTGKSWKFQPMWRALFWQGLPHPIHLVGLMIPVMLLVLAFQVQQYWAQRAETHVAVGAQMASIRAAAMNRRKPADAQRKLVFWSEYMEGLKAYRAQGLASASWDGEKVILRGPLDQRNLGRLRSIANGRGETLYLSTEGWLIKQALAMPELSVTEEVFEPADLALWLAQSEAALRLLDVKIELREAGEGSGYKEYKLQMVMPRGAVTAYRVLSEVLHDTPALLDRTTVVYEHSMATQAKVELTVWGGV